ncbi:hypothetical protein [Paraburkholderia azotifigens]|uniref:hypothetical protein n=1 Tax=Paraburkholderia azotifigens TaxID=2057004 RepID=UPI0038BA9522
MFSQRPRTGKFERLLLVAAYVLAIAIGERAAVSPGGDWQFLRNGFAEAIRLYVMFSDEACLFNNVFVGDGAIRVAASCTEVAGDGGKP